MGCLGFPGRMDLRERAAPSAPRKSFLPHNAGLEGPLFHGGAYGGLNAEAEFITIRRDDRWGKKPQGFFERVECRGIAALSAPRKSFLPHNAGLEGPLFHGGAGGGLNAEAEFKTIRRDDRWGKKPQGFFEPVECRGRAALSAPRKSSCLTTRAWKARSSTVAQAAVLMRKRSLKRFAEMIVGERNHKDSSNAWSAVEERRFQRRVNRSCLTTRAWKARSSTVTHAAV